MRFFMPQDMVARPGRLLALNTNYLITANIKIGNETYKIIMSDKKTSRTFRLEDRMWNHVVAEANIRNVKPTQIVIEAISEHLGRVIRHRNEIDDSQLLQVLKQTEDLKAEIEKIEKSIGKF